MVMLNIVPDSASSDSFGGLQEPIYDEVVTSHAASGTFLDQLRTEHAKQEHVVSTYYKTRHQVCLSILDKGE